MNSQEHIEQNIRMLIGDLQVRLLIANARIAELEQGLQEDASKEEPQFRPNGADIPKEASP